MKDAGVSDDEIEKQSDSETDTPTESGVDRIEFDKKDKNTKIIQTVQLVRRF
jgi:hypothetical protein